MIKFQASNSYLQFIYIVQHTIHMKYVDNVSLSYKQVHNICRQYDTTGLEFIFRWFLNETFILNMDIGLVRTLIKK